MTDRIEWECDGRPMTAETWRTDQPERVRVLAVTNRGSRTLHSLVVRSPSMTAAGRVQFSGLIENRYQDALELGDLQVGERRPFMARFLLTGMEGPVPGVTMEETDPTEKVVVTRDGWRLAPGWGDRDGADVCTAR